MPPRKTSTKKIDAAQVCAQALRNVKTQADYNRIVAANDGATLNAAWDSLFKDEQTRIHAICSKELKPNINAIATEIVKCDNIIQLQALKAQHGEDAVRTAWRLLPVDERLRLKAICDGQKAEETPVTDNPTVNNQVEEPKPQVRSLFSISDDLEKLNELLDECDQEPEQQELINQWLELLGEERDKKLDSYAALITEMMARAEVRKAEAKRMMELAAIDENRAKLLKDRLKWFFETHNLKTVETPRYRLSLAKNGGKQPLTLRAGLAPNEIEERFQKVSIDLDTTAIREALEAGEQLDFAALGDRGTSVRIK